MALISCLNKNSATSSLERVKKLDDAAHFLMLISDQRAGLIENCSLSSGEALRLLQPLHAQIDDELKNVSGKIGENLLDNCSEDCHCGLYADATQNEILKNKFYLKAKNLTKEKHLSCVIRTSKWICQDPLLKELKAQEF